MSDVVSIASSQVGVKEAGGLNDGEPFRRYALKGEQPLAWCARFARWCFARAGVPLPGNPYEIAAVKRLHLELSARGAILPPSAEPRRCDLILLTERGKSDAGRGHHVGIVERVENGLVHSIDGNWGDAVRRVTRNLDDASIWGYGRWPVQPAA